MSNARSSAGRLFQTVGPATRKLLSENFVLVRGTAYVGVSDERRLRPPEVDVSLQSSARYGSKMTTLCPMHQHGQFVLNPTHTGSQCKRQRTGLMWCRLRYCIRIGRHTDDGQEQNAARELARKQKLIDKNAYKLSDSAKRILLKTFSVWFGGQGECTGWSKKTDTQFYFWNNFGNSAPILTIL